MCSAVLLSCTEAWTDKLAPSAVSFLFSFFFTWTSYLFTRDKQKCLFQCASLVLSVRFCSAVTSSSLQSSRGDVNAAGSLHLLQNVTLSQRCSSASLWLKHDPWCVTTLYPLPLYPLVVYLYPQSAINPQVKVLPFSPINLPSWATLHWSSKLSAERRLVSLWEANSYYLNISRVNEIRNFVDTVSLRFISHLLA